MASISRTAKFKAHDPTGHKLRCARSAVDHYSEAYWDFLEQLRPHEAELRQADSKRGMRAIVKDRASVSVKGALRSGIIEDALFNLLSYFELDGDEVGQDTSWPAPPAPVSTSAEEVLQELTNGLPSIKRETELKNALKTKPSDLRRPVYLSKYRHAPILRSDDGEKLWVAPKISPMGRETYLPGEYVREVSGLPKTRTTTSYVLFPIELSQWHMHRFFREGTPKSCRMEVDGEDVWFHYAFTFGAEPVEPEAVVGVDRGRAVTGAWTAVTRGGELIERGASMEAGVRERLKSIENQIAEAQRRGADPAPLWEKHRRFVHHTMHHITNRIVDLAEKHSAMIALEDLENITGATGNSNLDVGLSRSQYGRLREQVEYKAKERGLHVTAVAPQWTSLTCPCGHTGEEARPSRDAFRCPVCGYEDHADLNAARMVALRGVEYLEGGGFDSFGDFVQSLELR